MKNKIEKTINTRKKKDIKDKVVDFQIILGRMLPYTRDLAKEWSQIYWVLNEMNGKVFWMIKVDVKHLMHAFLYFDELMHMHDNLS